MATVGTDSSIQVFWTQVAETLRNRISAQDWVSWFSGAQATDIGAERITIQVVNEFAARWVDGRFRPALEQAVADVAGVALDVEIVAAPTAPAPVDQRPHEQLAQAARMHPISSPDTADASHARVDPSAAGGSGTVMTEAQLLAELSSDDVVPSRSLDAATPLGAQLAPTGGTSHRAAPSAPRRPDHEIAGVQQLNDRYRFETFVIGPGNQMVHAAALSVAESPSQSYNPLFIHGSTGLGKTHLLHAIGHYVRDTRPDARVAYVTTEQFLANFMQVIQAAKSGGGDARDRFKAYFRGVDVLLMDDVQFVSNRGSWVQEELFHIFNALHENGRQIVLTSDVGPERIPKLEERLRSRFAWGLIADIETPDRETRIAILRKKAQVHALDVPREVFEEIATRIDTSVRELEGALTRVVAAASFAHEPVTVELAHRVLEAFSPAQCEPVTIERIQNVICEHYAIDKEDLLSIRRTDALNVPRQIAMYLSRTLLGTPAKQVALRFNRKDHTTVLHAERKIDNMIREDQEVHDVVAQLTHAVRGTAGRVGVER